MDNNKKVRLVKKLEVSDLAGEKVMIDFDSGKYFMLKGSANEIWDIIQEEVTTKEITEQLMSEYEIDREECEKSVDDFLNTLLKYKFIVME